MPKYVLTVVTRGDNYLHSVHETEEGAKEEQQDLLAKLNNALTLVEEPFTQVGDHVFRLTDIQRTQVSSEDEAPGYGTGFA